MGYAAQKLIIFTWEGSKSQLIGRLFKKSDEYPDPYEIGRSLFSLNALFVFRFKNDVARIRTGHEFYKNQTKKVL
jgi:hypothetical protein